MSTSKADPVEAQRLWAEFADDLNDMTGALVWGAAGLPPLAAQIDTWDVKPGVEVLAGRGDPNDPATRSFHSWTIETLRDNVAPGGLVTRLFGRMWLVTVYGLWEDHYRGRLATALGLAKKDDLVDDVFGDLRLLRHDIVHCRAIATAKHTGKAKTLHWASVGDEIIVNDQRVLEVLEYLQMTASTLPDP